MTAFDENDSQKGRRAQPTAGAPPGQRPNTPSTGIPPAQFYGHAGALPTPPPLPERPRGVGSSLTSYTTIDLPPAYGPSAESEFREPELVEDIRVDEPMPSLLEDTQNWAPSADWAGFSDTSAWANTAWGDSGSSKVPIERNTTEEDRWWDGSVWYRPGPGMFPPAVETLLHDPEHTLFSVTASMPNNPPPRTNAAAPPPDLPAHAPPTPDEVRTAIPHPNAYFCPRDNAWVLLSWKSSSVDPPLNQSHKHLASDGRNFSYQRSHNPSCSDDSVSFKPNRTHHFHKYAGATDSSQLTPPYCPPEAEEAMKRKRRSVYVLDEDALDVNTMDIDQDAEETGFALDLYMCCQCPMYCVASPPIPGVIDSNVWNAYVKDRFDNPRLGIKAQTVVGSVQKLIGIVEALLFQAVMRSLKITPTFIDLIGYDDNVKAIFKDLEFTFTTTADNGMRLNPPIVTAGLPVRAKLLRAWVEMSAWLFDFRRKHSGTELRPPFALSVDLVNAREMIQTAIGSHHDQIPREPATENTHFSMSQVSEFFWAEMGLTPTTVTADILEFAYYAQCRCDPKNTPQYFTHLYSYVRSLSNLGTCPLQLEELVSREEARGRFTLEDVERSGRVLGFGEGGDLRMRVEEVEDAFVVQAWEHVVRESWKASSSSNANTSNVTSGSNTNTSNTTNTTTNSEQTQKAADEALRVLAQARGSRTLMDKFEEAQRTMMNPARAYQVLELDPGVECDDTMLVTIYGMRVEEQPAQGDKWRAALMAVAEARNSERLRVFARSGVDPGEMTVGARPDWPRGLNQLGNTCYLNSLLQYFYTIKDLRDAVRQGVKSLEDDQNVKLSDDELKRHRVGGRLVTRREILRSKKFVNQLADLFFHLEHDTRPAVTPTIELAKLALVTSKDEEEDEEMGWGGGGGGAGAGTESSNDTDATLVEDGPLGGRANVSVNDGTSADAAGTMSASTSASTSTDAPPPKSPSPALSPGSVLGKRPRDVVLGGGDGVGVGGVGRTESAMDVDASASTSTSIPTPTTPDLTSSTSTTSMSMSTSTSTTPLAPTLSPLRLDEEDDDGPPPLIPVDYAHDGMEGMDGFGFASGSGSGSRNGGPPPLPPRKASQMMSDSDMMFGKQHDVAECMDNCMFQIETALLKFDTGEGAEGGDSDKTSVVKRLFYGTIRQNVLAADQNLEKEDLFSHLPVNVGAEEGFDIYDGLGQYFYDVVEYKGDRVPMEMAVVSLPPLLHVQLQRVKFDRELVQSWKSQAYVKFGETIYMDRFMEDADPEKKKRARGIEDRLTAARERLGVVQRPKNTPYTTALDHTREFISKQADLFPEVDDTLLAALTAESALLSTEIADLHTQIASLKSELEDVWKGEERVAYELTSVFIHRGSTPTFGHYFFYGRNPGEEEWFKYNDSEVTRVGREEVLGDSTGSTANPYLLVFARKDSGVVDAVRRFSEEEVGGEGLK